MAEGAPLGRGSSPLALAAGDGVALRGAILPGGTRGTVLLLQGRTEFCEKYAPTAADLAARGFCVATVDWRGQGGSARLLADPRKGHVDDFTAYQRDLRALLAAPQVAALPGPRVMLAHSMGGAIGLRALLDGTAGASAAVFSAPMWGLAQGRLARAVARLLARAGVALGLGERYAPGSGRESYAETDPQPHLLTADPGQAAWLKALTLAHPDLALGGPTLGWLRAAFAEMDALAPRPLALPALIVVGGEEGVTCAAAMRARALRDGLEMATIPGGRHELLLEAPARRAAALAAIDGFLGRRGL